MDCGLGNLRSCLLAGFACVCLGHGLVHARQPQKASLLQPSLSFARGDLTFVSSETNPASRDFEPVLIAEGGVRPRTYTLTDTEQPVESDWPVPLPKGMIPPITGPTTEDERAFEIGEPLGEESWLIARHSAGMFAGTIGGATPIDSHLDQSAGGMFGIRLGYDYDYRWGLEKRFGFAELSVFDAHDHHRRQIIDLELGDVDLLFYPWGDTRWRPYMAAGIGIAHFNYQSDLGHRIDRLLLGLPFGLGVKYFWNAGISFRVELLDNLMIGNHEVSTMNNISLGLGAEFRYRGFQLH